MISLGIEGTAHTISCGIVDEDRVISNVSSVYHNPNGGIHPREAAIHHAENVSTVVSRALTEGGLHVSDVDLISFSRGPGLGPCLRIAATAARTLAIRSGRPLLGVNHPLGHVEIGRKLTGAKDPMMLYVSGGNTQVIAHVNGRYRVLGETMDIGLGNLLDKTGREMNMPFPAGPRIEELAGKGDRLLELPYSVKGMDTSFSGMFTAAKRYLDSGESRENVCYSVQEHAFAMLVEVLERGIYQTNKDEILLAGGVARNQRLREMIQSLSSDLGMKAYLTDDEFCMDNGAMIAQAGLLMHQNGYTAGIEFSTVDQRFRIDEVDAPWIRTSTRPLPKNMGAESRIEFIDYRGRSAVRKVRIQKKYREAGLDGNLRRERLRNEVNIIARLAEIGIDVPVIYDVDMEEAVVIYEKLGGSVLRDLFTQKISLDTIMENLGSTVGRMHENEITHGDLTASNIIVEEGGRLNLIDTSLGRIDSRFEDMAVDLYLLTESIKVYRSDWKSLFSDFLTGYQKNCAYSDQVQESMKDVEKRRRYV